jgi:hypothetical protein
MVLKMAVKVEIGDFRLNLMSFNVPNECISHIMRLLPYTDFNWHQLNFKSEKTQKKV